MGSANQPDSTVAGQRKARIEEMRRADRARQRRNRALAVAASVVVVAGLAVGGVVLVQSRSGDTEPAAKASTSAAAQTPGGMTDKSAKNDQSGKNGQSGKGASGHFVTGADGVRTWQGTLGRTHTTAPVTYPMEPPVGGDHNPVWQNCNGDVYTAPLKNEHAVHALEHGAVWVTYNAKAPKADVAALAAKVRRTPYTLMSPVAGQKDPIMLSAWAHQRTVTGAADPNVDAFFAKFVQGPQTPEPGAACTGGVGQ
ncbi:DUF3105 domain-containing protein [Streptomyces sp. NPDC056160]|uniref:DUF3105 domain-containing protein n=1 Tax=Streptomyces sp. NPDC056160 TaxID=3345731 RepID=UPI0035DC2218